MSFITSFFEVVHLDLMEILEFLEENASEHFRSVRKFIKYLW